LLKRPSSKRKSHGEQIELNLIPILDTMVTLIGFLLYTMAFLQIVSVESPLPAASPTEVVEKLKEKPLQLTVSLREHDSEIWSPFEKIQAIKIPNINLNTPEELPDFKTLHESLIKIKTQFPTENRVVLAPAGNMNYDHLVAAMDAIRVLEKTDPAIYAKNPTTNIDEQVKNLFPDVMFGNLLGED
jgi:biopolymer transport protein ExbD